jgi:sugar lactone lactonase YvrE
VDGFGDVYVMDSSNHRIQKFTNAGDFILEWGSNGSAPEQFRFPIYGTVDSEGSVYVSDLLNDRLKKFDGQGNLQWSRAIGNPKGVAIDDFDIVYVNRNPSGDFQRYVARFDAEGNSLGQFRIDVDDRGGIAVDAMGCVHVTRGGQTDVYSQDGSRLGRWIMRNPLGSTVTSSSDIAVNASNQFAIVDPSNSLVEIWSGPPVQTEPSTWGRLKANWR